MLDHKTNCFFLHHCVVLLSNCANIYLKMRTAELIHGMFHPLRKFQEVLVNSIASVTINTFLCERNMRIKGRGMGKLFMSNYFHIFYGHKFHFNNNNNNKNSFIFIFVVVPFHLRFFWIILAFHLDHEYNLITTMSRVKEATDSLIIDL